MLLWKVLKGFFYQRTSWTNIGVCLFGGIYLQYIACIKEKDLGKLHKSLVLTVFFLVELDDGKMFNNKPSHIIINLSRHLSPQTNKSQHLFNMFFKNKEDVLFSDHKILYNKFRRVNPSVCLLILWSHLFTTLSENCFQLNWIEMMMMTKGTINYCDGDYDYVCFFSATLSIHVLLAFSIFLP